METEEKQSLNVDHWSALITNIIATSDFDKNTRTYALSGLSIINQNLKPKENEG